MPEDRPKAIANGPSHANPERVTKAEREPGDPQHVSGQVSQSTNSDIDALKRGLAASEAARQYAEALIEIVQQPLMVLDADLRVRRATSAYCETFMVTRQETEGQLVYEIGNGQWNAPRLRELLTSALFRPEPFLDFEVEHDFPHIGRRTMRLSGRSIPHGDAQERSLLVAIEDVTARCAIAEMRLQRLFETSKDGIVVIDAETATVQNVNRFFLELTGLERHEFIGKKVSHAGELPGIGWAAGIIAATEESEVVRRDDVEITTKTGLRIPVDVVANRYLVGSQAVVQLNIRDVRGRRQSEKALLESEERFRIVVETPRDYAIFQLDGEGMILSWNAGAERLLGWQEGEAIGKSGSIVFTPEDVELGEPERELAQALTEGRAKGERWHMRKDGTRFFAIGVLTLVNRHEGRGPVFTKVVQDITNRKEQDDRQRQRLEEKSVLVREIHHRIQNNLQMIVSLLKLQSSHVSDSGLLSAFEETVGRVGAIARIHEHLDASGDLGLVEAGAYLKAAAEELISLHSEVPGGVQLQVSGGEILLGIETAIPVGLIANELIRNSLKHGLGAQSGRLEVIFERVSTPVGSAPQVRLRVCDTGAGFPAGFDPSSGASMGYRLVTILARQLRAHLEIGNEGGASVTVTFPVPLSGVAGRE